MKVILLPNYFKIIGSIILILSVVTFFVQTQSGLLSFDEDFEIPVTGLLIGAFILNIAKEKVEDERVHRLRLLTWAQSFYYLCFLVISGKVFNFFLTQELEFFNSGIALATTVLLSNLLNFARNKSTDGFEE